MRLRVFSLAAVCFSILALADGEASGATIFVTSLNQKIGGPGTGGCSLQEAIYSSVLHDTFDGTHGLAIDATDPDHFITTDCVLGTGNDTIVLPSKGVLRMTAFLDGDAYNPYGPTATPIILSTISIQGNGATLQWTGSGNARLFAVGPAPPGGIATPNGTASGTGNLKLKDVHVKGFHVKGGNGGGGGLGAGGAIYMRDPRHQVGSDQLNGGEFAPLTARDWALLQSYLGKNESIFGIPLERLLTVDGTRQPPEFVYRKIIPAGHKALMPEEAWVRREA